VTVAIIGALVIGLSLGLLGSGGSILTVPLLVYLLGHDEKAAMAESLIIVGAIALIGLLPLVRRIDVPVAIVFAIPAMVGAWAGARASIWMSGQAQLLLFAVVMLVAAFFMLRSPRRTHAPRRRTALRWVAVGVEGLCVGALTGLVGVGGGFVIVPALVLLAGLSMHAAVATSLLIIAMKSVTGTLGYMDVLHETGGQIQWPIVMVFITLGGIGVLAGTRIGARVPHQTLRRVFGVFIIVMGVFIAVRESVRLSDAGVIDPSSVEAPSVEGDGA
jgi:uncharacterized membrane protein YfcA